MDIEEGADIVMVKPALSYLDYLRGHGEFEPTAAYQVSGEYSMIKAAAAQRMDEDERAMLEPHGDKRAGADIIITYFARGAPRALMTMEARAPDLKGVLPKAGL